MSLEWVGLRDLPLCWVACAVGYELMAPRVPATSLVDNSQLGIRDFKITWGTFVNHLSSLSIVLPLPSLLRISVLIFQD